jgi:hypothetical protein
MIIAKSKTQSLYEVDFSLWLEATLFHLRSRDIHQLDWEHLIEEIEALGISQRHEAESRLKTILAHVLKRCYVPLPDCFRGWQVTIVTQRNDLKRLLKKAPSLRNHLNIELDCLYQDAYSEVCEEYSNSQFPQNWPFDRTLDNILTQEFWNL